MNNKTINSFRNKINSNNYFILHMYRENEGKNHWNCICACMDWLDVSINSLIDLQINDTNINNKSMKAFSFLSSVDIIIESVIQLHRVLVDNKSEPFSEEKSIFVNGNHFKNDKLYFKHIRAIFGAHPVNLNGTDNIKWFASWPTDHVYREYDLAVYLYPSDPSLESQVFGFKFNDIWSIADKYYSYLQVLILKIDFMYDEYCKNLSSEIIPYSDSKLEFIEILQLESKNRLNNSYYKYILNDLKLLFEAHRNLKIHNDKIENYIVKLDKLLTEVHFNLQYMKFEVLESDYLVSPDFPQEILYCLQKSIEALKNEGHNLMLEYHLNKISVFLEPYIDLTEADSNEEILLYIYTGLYYSNKN